MNGYGSKRSKKSSKSLLSKKLSGKVESKADKDKFQRMLKATRSHVGFAEKIARKKGL